MSRYAADTSVSVANSKAEIERIVERYGATGFMSGWTADQAVIAFAMNDRQVRFTLKMPRRESEEFTTYMRGSVKSRREDAAAAKLWEQACRQRWRALALVIKAKLEAVESDISTFEDEFMSSIVMPNGRTVSEEVRPLIARAYETGSMPPLLPDYSA
jgi:hypothetical protein